MRTTIVFTLLCLTGSAALSAQAVVDPGMSKAQVIAKLGKPTVERSADTLTFLFYRNGVERRVGMSDVVTLTNDAVVDAVFRSGARRYSGKSSSPVAIPPEVARKQRPRSVPLQIK
ncbi:MAG TPA: hypothetical protein VHE78_03730 [Gemmatimonadaceae bacterium]|nr:hypothetical protein [Gemmatimonadaceae bacterium]